MRPSESGDEANRCDEVWRRRATLPVGQGMTTALSDERVGWHLWNWERWQQYSRSPGRYPSRASSGIIGSSHLDFDETLAGIDRNNAEATEAVLWDMTPQLRLAVHVTHRINSVYRVRDVESAYAIARVELGIGLARRGKI